MEFTAKVPKQNHAYDVCELRAIRLAQQGDPNAFEQLYKAHSRRVYCSWLRIVRNSTEAEELTQDVFLQLFRKIHTFRGESALSVWLHRLTVNTVFMRMRKKRHPEVPLYLTTEGAENDEYLAIEPGGLDLRLNGLLDRINLRKAIDQLATGYKRIFILHDIEGYERNEIAHILGCSIGNCKSQLSRARLRLRELLQEILRSRSREKRESNRGLSMRRRRYPKVADVKV
jgi:RNA polymerase sigma-70 factor, ECF subfamily